MNGCARLLLANSKHLLNCSERLPSRFCAAFSHSQYSKFETGSFTPMLDRHSSLEEVVQDSEPERIAEWERSKKLSSGPRARDSMMSIITLSDNDTGDIKSDSIFVEISGQLIVSVMLLLFSPPRYIQQRSSITVICFVSFKSLVQGSSNIFWAIWRRRTLGESWTSNIYLESG